MSAIVLDGKIHLLGGRDVRSVEWHEIYDPATDKYYDSRAACAGSTGTQPFVGQRDHMGVAVVDGKIHAIAGRMDSYDFNTALNAVYDPKTDAWTFRAPLPTPRSGPSCVYINGKIVVFGGEATGKVFGTNEAYDPKTDTWEQLTPMAVPRHGLHGATVRGDRQYGARARWWSRAGWPGAGRLSRRLYVRLNTVTAEIMRPPQGRPHSSGIEQASAPGAE